MRSTSPAAVATATRTTSTKEQADYNLEYLVAVALLDGQVGPEQLETERVCRGDVQDLLARVRRAAAGPDRGLSGAHRGPRAHRLNDGGTFIASNPTSRARPLGRCRGTG